LGEETSVKLDVYGHMFKTKGLMVRKKGFLEVYPQPWGKILPIFSEDEKVELDRLEVKQG